MMICPECFGMYGSWRIKYCPYDGCKTTDTASKEGKRLVEAYMKRKKDVE